MQVTKSLEVLKVNNCGLGDQSAQMILEAHQKNPQFRLRRLEVGNNKFGEAGAKALNQACRLMGSVTHLALPGSLETEDNGLKHLLTGLHECSSLRHLDISSNKGATNAIAELTDIFTHSLSLYHLNLSSLSLSPPNQQALVQSLLAKLSTSFNLNSALTELIWQDSLSPPNQKELQEGLQSTYNNKVTILQLDSSK